MESKAQVRKAVGAGIVTLFFFVLQQTLAGVAVSPLTQHIEVKPGKTAEFKITVANNQRDKVSFSVPLKIDILDFQVSDYGQLLFGPEYKHERSAAGWITLEANEVILKAGESRAIKGTVKAPLDADGDYWASAMVYIGESQSDVKGVQVKMRTATGLFIRVVRRTNSERGSVTDVNIIMPSFEPGPFKKDAERDAYARNEKQSLKIDARLTNEGLISIPAKGKTFIYTSNMKKIATVHLYANRNNVLPGDSRWFRGVISQPLPAGQYKLRTVFSSAKNKRQILKDVDLTIDDDLAKIWAQNAGAENNITRLQFDPEKIDLKLNQGRTTTTNFQVKNAGLNTVAGKCRIENAGQNWLELKDSDFTLSPNSSTSMLCSVKVPSDAKAGIYKWTVIIDMEQSGLENQPQTPAVQYTIPISIAIDENSKVATKY